MTDFTSFSRVEHELAPKLRNSLNHAESSEDVKKFFSYTAQELLGKALGEGVRVHFEDVSLARDGKGFTVSERLQADAGYARTAATSDLRAILERFAESAQHRMRHLEGHPEKTQSKIRGH
jgi:hypothetical protein